jgi:hypothetical protein
MPTYDEQVIIELTNFSADGVTPTIGEPSLVVQHNENGIAPGVDFNNNGGGYFVQRFTFGGDSTPPQQESASFVADWHGLSVIGFQTLQFAIGTPWWRVRPTDPLTYKLPLDIPLQITKTNVQVNTDLTVTGDVFLIGGADCAEDFDIMQQEKVEPGTVMVINDTGKLEESQQAYDKRVAGVISGAGVFKPAITLDKQISENNRQPIALLGKVYCKVDAQYGAIEVGDMLTTSPTLGYAMKALDPFKAFGAVIGKALRPLKNGRGLLPILVAIQ